MTFVPQDDYPKDIECPLCLESFDSPVEARPCKHVFCFACLTKLGRHAVCPLCRKDIATHAAAPKPLRKQAALIQGHCDGSLLLRRGPGLMDEPPAASSGPKTPVASVGGQWEIWRCENCSKLKPLHGMHLVGKSSVRSDCWHCAKKRTFNCEGIRACEAEECKKARPGQPPAAGPGKPTQSEGEIRPCDWTGTRADFAQHLEQVQHHVEQRDTTLSDLQAATDAEDEEASERFQNILGALLGGMVVESPDEAFALMEQFTDNRKARVNGWGISMQRDVQLAMSHPLVRQSQLRSQIARISAHPRFFMFPDSDDDDDGLADEAQRAEEYNLRAERRMEEEEWERDAREFRRSAVPYHRGWYSPPSPGPYFQQGYQPSSQRRQMNPVPSPQTYVDGPQPQNYRSTNVPVDAAPQHVSHQGPPSQHQLPASRPAQPSSVRRNDPYAQQGASGPQYGTDSAPPHDGGWRRYVPSQRVNERYAASLTEARHPQNFGPGMSVQQPVPQYPIRQPQQHVRSQPPPSYHSQQHQRGPWNHQWGTQPPPPPAQQGALPAPSGDQSGQYGPAGRGPPVDRTNQGGHQYNGGLWNDW